MSMNDPSNDIDTSAFTNKKMMNDRLVYQGSELELFAHAMHWKEYWSSLVRPYLGRETLEVGAGIGSITRLLAGVGVHWTCLEPDPRQAGEIISWSNQERMHDVKVITGILSDIPAKNRYDTILYIDVLEHIEDDHGEVRRAYDHLQSGGHLIVLVPAHQRLYTPFDRAIGHFRRYNRTQLEALAPPGAIHQFSHYLDSCGLFASLANRLILNASMPTAEQISFWDRRLVPISRKVDRMLGYSLGKSLVMVCSKP